MSDPPATRVPPEPREAPQGSAEGTSPVRAPVEIAALVEEGQGLVRSLAMEVHRSLPVRMDLDDLIAYGQVGLTEAAQRYDASSNTRFTTFAYYRIRGAIYDGVSKMNWTSRARIRRMRFQRMADEVLENEACESPEAGPPREDAAWLGRVTERLAIVYLATGEDDRSEASLAETPDLRESPSRVVADRELQQTLRKLVDRLPPDARRLIINIYFEGHTLTEAADRSGISKSWASRLHAKSLDQLAKALRQLGSD